MHPHIRKSGHLLFSQKAWKIRLVFWLGAIIVGVVCAIFTKAAETATLFFLSVAAFNPYLPLIITPVSLMLITWMTLRFFRGAHGSGIPQTIAALEVPTKSVLLSMKIAFGKIFLALAGLMSGASLGTQAPSVHIGASIMFSLGRMTRFPPHYMERGLILAGGAAGIAAAFNTPLAGIVFAIEEMSRSFEQRTSGIVVTAVIIAGLTAMTIFGSYHYFGTIPASLPDMSFSWLAIILCGIAGGLLGGLFSQTLILITRRVIPFALRKPLTMALIAGFAVALVNFISGYQSAGTGYMQAMSIFTQAQDFNPWYPVEKAAATLASFMTGIPGGIFAPSLATGAGIGSNLAHWLPGLASMETVILLGMLAYFTGVVQTPLTAFIIVMEMTNSQDMMLALIATAFIARGSSYLVCPKPLYRELADLFIRYSPVLNK